MRAQLLRTVLSVALVLAQAAGASEPVLGDPRMKRANEAASRVVRERMTHERPAEAKLLEQVSSADIVVVSGEYDRVEDVLRSLGIRHLVVRPSQVAKLELNAKQLLIIDCPGDLSRAGIERVRKFVNAGGYLYTTDWALTRVVQAAFPGFIKFNGRETADDVVAVEVKETDHNLLKHLTLAKDNPKWWLEGSSYPIRVLDKEKVDVLISSKEMGRKYGEAPVAVHFRYGDGQVLHIASHFYLQQNKTRTVAEAKKSKDYLKADSNLAPSTKKALEQNFDFAADVVAGDLGSAYAAQQMTTNIVVERKKDQTRIDALYSGELKEKVPATRGVGRAEAAPALNAGTKVRELERKDGQVRVRTMSGDEAWVPASAL